jgi:hypothetical protein
MKTYWLIVLALAVADASLVALLFLKDGGPESLVWWTVLIIPMLVAALIVLGLILQLVVMVVR